MKKKIQMLYRIIACLLAMSMLVLVSACSSSDSSLAEREKLIEELYGSVELAGTNDETTNDATTSNFVLAYSRSDPLNPYACESTLNAVICDLLYDQLLTVTSEFEAEMVIAAQIEQTASKLITVTLRDGVVFSDGSEITARDIRYSFEAACSTDSRYKDQLSCFTGCTVAQNLVYFRTATPDPRAYMLLDFPIIKADTDYGTAIPTGSGRYVYVTDVEKGTFLVRNQLWYSTNTSNVERISLVSMPTIESIVHSIEIGTVSYYYTDLRDGYPSRINANYSSVDINNLIYIGINTTDARLTQYSVRDAINHALDREEIISSAYAGRAYAATGPLTTSWPAAAEAQSGSTLADTSTAVTSLEDSGFINLDENYIRSDGNGSRLAFTLLVNTANEQHVTTAQHIATQLREVGFDVTVVQLSFDQLRERIAAGDYSMYLGEYALFNNMDFSALYTPNSGLYYGLSPINTISANESYLNGDSSLADLIDAFDAELPFIPVCYRLGMVCYSRSLSANMDVTESDFFYHIGDWDVALASSESE